VSKIDNSIVGDRFTIILVNFTNRFFVCGIENRWRFWIRKKWRASL